MAGGLDICIGVTSNDQKLLQAKEIKIRWLSHIIQIIPVSDTLKSLYRR